MVRTVYVVRVGVYMTGRGMNRIKIETNKPMDQDLHDTGLVGTWGKSKKVKIRERYQHVYT